MSLTTTLAGKSKGSFLPFYDSFTRGDGPLVAPWQSGGATWTIVSNEVINTPTEGAEDVSNGEFTVDLTGWTDNLATISQVDSAVDPGVPSGGADNGAAKKVNATGAFSEGMFQALAAATGTWVLAMCRAYSSSANVRANAADLFLTPNTTGLHKYTTGEDAWEILVASARITGAASVSLLIGGNNAGDIAYHDSVSVKPLTLNTLFSDVETSTADVTVQVEIDTLEPATQAGLVLNLDSVASPANFVIAYHDGTNARLEKCVAGTYTSVISAAAVYAAGATIQVVKSGTDYSLYYNSAQVGATQTINDAGIIDNTQHGMFNTYSGNQLDEFRCEKN